MSEEVVVLEKIAEILSHIRWSLLVITCLVGYYVGLMAYYVGIVGRKVQMSGDSYGTPKLLNNWYVI